MVDTVIDFFPELMKLEVRFTMPARHWDFSYGIKKNLFEWPLVTMNRHRKIQIEYDVYLIGDLFSINKKLIGDDDLAGEMRGWGQNFITYHAVPTDEVCAYHGLALSTHVAGTYDYEAMVAWAKAKIADP